MGTSALAENTQSANILGTVNRIFGAGTELTNIYVCFQRRSFARHPTSSSTPKLMSPPDVLKPGNAKDARSEKSESSTARRCLSGITHRLVRREGPAWSPRILPGLPVGPPHEPNSGIYLHEEGNPPWLLAQTLQRLVGALPVEARRQGGAPRR